jgi:hypothetical protein
MEAEMSGGDVSAADEGENMGRKNIIIPGGSQSAVLQCR